MYEEFRRIGKILFGLGIVGSHSGNLSIRAGDRIYITRRGSMVGDLRESDIVETGVFEDDSGIVMASTEIKVHRAIYQKTPALAIVHAHPPYAIAMSMLCDEIFPRNTEGAYFYHKIPVVAAEMGVGSEESAKKVSDALRDYKGVILRGHGSFVHAKLLEDALSYTSVLESACRTEYMLWLAGKKPESSLKW
ncbi:MAG TPA: aldolase [Candidatus Methanofastidiosa archaeon]|nr:aldolase [Candidatus Methanofastidiosa archaeon]